MARRRGGDSRWPGYALEPERPPPSAAELEQQLGRPPQPVSGNWGVPSTALGREWGVHISDGYGLRAARGRIYTHRGRVLDLDVQAGRITGVVMGSRAYTLVIEVDLIASQRWAALVRQYTSELPSLVALLAGDIPLDAAAITGAALFPGPEELSCLCSCPDEISRCKHVEALLYGLAFRLDERPELLFTLRGVQIEELVALVRPRRTPRSADAIPNAEVGEIFGIALEAEAVSAEEVGSEDVAEPMPPLSSRRKWIDQAELRARGLSSEQIQAWVAEGHLLVVEGREGYRLMPEARRRLRG